MNPVELVKLTALMGLTSGGAKSPSVYSMGLSTLAIPIFGTRLFG